MGGLVNPKRPLHILDVSQGGGKVVYLKTELETGVDYLEPVLAESLDEGILVYDLDWLDDHRTPKSINEQTSIRD